MLVLRSTGAAAALSPGLVMGTPVSVVYPGPKLDPAVLVWKIRLVQLAGATSVFGRFSLLNRRLGLQIALPLHQLFLGATGSVREISGTAVLELLPGDVLSCFGFLDAPGGFELEANGLTVVVL